MNDYVADGFTQLLRLATSEVDSAYFYLPQDGQASVFRERVYCYELYHQLRTSWKASSLQGTKYLLNGEVDKSGHRRFATKGLRHLKPDFVLHCPGNMKDNHTVVEVKSASYQALGLRKDLLTLHKLHAMEDGYRRQILLVYGQVSGLARLKQLIMEFRDASKIRSPLELWNHANPGSSAVCVGQWDCTEG